MSLMTMAGVTAARYGAENSSSAWYRGIAKNAAALAKSLHVVKPCCWNQLSHVPPEFCSYIFRYRRNF
jgi:hypothetical protein